MTDHIPDVSKMVPWAYEPTPIIDGSDMYYPDTAIEVGRKLERRMRAAERLLEDALLTYHNGMTTLQDHTADQIRAHLESARKEDA